MAYILFAKDAALKKQYCLYVPRKSARKSPVQYFKSHSDNGLGNASLNISQRKQ